jgi:hypothetical protein
MLTPAATVTPVAVVPAQQEESITCGTWVLNGLRHVVDLTVGRFFESPTNFIEENDNTAKKTAKVALLAIASLVFLIPSLAVRGYELLKGCCCCKKAEANPEKELDVE